METKKIRVGLIYGGRSGEHEVSLRSAASVLRHLSPSRYIVELLGITHEGEWYYQPKTLLKKVLEGDELKVQKKNPISISPMKGLSFLKSDGTNQALEVDIILPILHGTFGEDGTIQGLLEMVGIPYLGSGVLGSSLGMDKEKVKQVWEQAGLPVVPYKVLQLSRSKELPAYSKIEDMWRSWSTILGNPLFVKPSRAGSSVGISKATSPKELEKALSQAALYDTKILAEAGVVAREIECSVIGNLSARAYTPGEVVPNHEFYDYDAKYLDPNGAALLIPAPLPLEVVVRIRDLAERAYRASEARGLARVDFFYDEINDKIWINEINTMPGFTSISMFSKMCEADGLSYSEILDELVDLAFEEFSRKAELSYRH